MERKVQIYCPKCGWEPRQEDCWSCGMGCGCVWNTFDTGGVCPACGKAWEQTQCLACHGWSPHRAWYHDSGGDRIRKEAREEEPAVVGGEGGR